MIIAEADKSIRRKNTGPYIIDIDKNRIIGYFAGPLLGTRATTTFLCAFSFAPCIYLIWVPTTYEVIFSWFACFWMESSSLPTFILLIQRRVTTFQTNTLSNETSVMQMSRRPLRPRNIKWMHERASGCRCLLIGLVASVAGCFQNSTSTDNQSY